MKTWGIYDDTEDLHRAIALSDAYYGDQSSVAHLYKATKKPILLQTLASSFGGKMAPGFFCRDDEEANIIWSASVGHNALYRIDLDSLEYSFEGRFPNYDITEEFLFFDAAKIGDTIFFPSFHSKEIATFNTKTGIFGVIEFPKEFLRNGLGTKHSYGFINAVAYDNYLYLLPQDFPGIVRYEIYKGEFEISADFTGMFDASESGIYFYKCKAQGSEIFAFSETDNSVLVFNMDTCASDTYKLGSGIQKFRDICFDGEYFWLSPLNGKSTVIRWDKTRGWHEEIKLDGSDRLFTANMCYCDGYVWLLPMWGRLAYRINAHNLQIEEAEVFNKIASLPDTDSKNASNSREDSIYWYLIEADGTLISYLHKAGEIVSYRPSDERCQRLCIRESNSTCIEIFVAELLAGQKAIGVDKRTQSCRINIQNGGAVGERIYAYIADGVLPKAT